MNMQILGVASPSVRKVMRPFPFACMFVSAAVPPPNRRRSATTTISRHFPVRRRWRRIVRDPFTFRRPGRRRREARRETLRQRSLLRGSRPPMTLRASSRVAPATSMLCRSSLLVPAPSIRSTRAPDRSPISHSSPASSSRVRGRYRLATPCAGSLATPKAEAAIPDVSTSWSSRRGLRLRPTSWSTPTGAPISSSCARVKNPTCHRSPGSIPRTGPAVPELFPRRQFFLTCSQRRYRYTLEGDNPPWRPVGVYDDGRKVYIEFSPGIVQGEMPPLFVIGPDGNSEIVNYRTYRNVLIVDRLFAAAELRLGGDFQQKVRIIRSDGRPS